MSRVINIVGGVTGVITLIAGIGYSVIYFSRKDEQKEPVPPICPTVSAAEPEAESPGQTEPPNRICENMPFGFQNAVEIQSFGKFKLCYDKRKRVPLWVFEHLTKESTRCNHQVQRSSTFYEDEKLLRSFRSTDSDYLGNGFDRGHMAAAANHRETQQDYNQTFIFSNIAPQVKGLNQGAWMKLEDHARELTACYMNVYVYSGPMYLPESEVGGKSYVRYQVIGENNVAVPTHFFKVIIKESDSLQLEVESYVMKNEAISYFVNLGNFLVPLENIERDTGIEFMDVDTKNKLNSTGSPHITPLNETLKDTNNVINGLKVVVEDLGTRLTTMSDKIEQLTNEQVAARLETKEGESLRKRSILVFGVPTGDNLESAVDELLFEKLQLPKKPREEMVESFFRIGKPDKEKRKIVIIFWSYAQKKSVMSNSYKLRSTNVSINDYLHPEDEKIILLDACRAARKAGMRVKLKKNCLVVNGVVKTIADIRKGNWLPAVWLPWRSR